MTNEIMTQIIDYAKIYNMPVSIGIDLVSYFQDYTFLIDDKPSTIEKAVLEYYYNQLTQSWVMRIGKINNIPLDIIHEYLNDMFGCTTPTDIYISGYTELQSDVLIFNIELNREL